MVLDNSEREHFFRKNQFHEMSRMRMKYLAKISFHIYDARKCSQLEHVFVSEMYDPKYTQN